MEPFLDGGLFELLFAIAFAYFLNYIFLRKYLLIIFSLILIAAPVILFIIPKNEFFNWILLLCFINSILTVKLVWKLRKENPAQPLLNVGQLQQKLTTWVMKWKLMFSKRSKAQKKEVQNV